MQARRGASRQGRGFATDFRLFAHVASSTGDGPSAAVADRKNMHRFILHAVKNPVSAAAFAVEKLPNPFLAKDGLRRKGASLRQVRKTLDGVAEAVKPFECRTLGQLIEVALSAFSMQDAVRQSVFALIPRGPLVPDALRPLRLGLH